MSKTLSFPRMDIVVEKKKVVDPPSRYYYMASLLIDGMKYTWAKGRTENEAIVKLIKILSIQGYIMQKETG